MEKKIYNKVADLQDDAIVLENSNPPLLLWCVYIFLTIGICIAVIGACVFKVDKVVTAEGKLETLRPNIVLKPFDRVVIKQVHVRVGDVVKKDQLLFSFDPTFSLAELQRLEQLRRSYSVQIARLKAELHQKDFVYDITMDRESFDQQRIIFLRRQRYFKENITFYDENIKRLSSILQTHERNLTKQRERLQALLRLEEMQQQLLKNHATSLKDLIELQIQRMQFEGDVDSLEGKIAENKHNLLSGEAEKQTFISQWYEKIAKELVDLERELDSVKQQIFKAKRSAALTELRAPCDAIVHEVSAVQEGAAVQEAEALITLVPQGEELVAMVNVSPRDIGKLKQGNSARIKLESYPFQRYGTLAGNIIFISGDAIQTQEKSQGKSQEQSFYRAQLKVSGKLNSNAGTYQLVPGMRVTAEIKVGKRKLIEYIIDPLIKALDESCNEPN